MRIQGKLPEWAAPAVGGAIGLLALLAIYGGHLDAPYYADDFQLYVPITPLDGLDHFIEPSPHNNFYRPLQNIVLGAVQHAEGMDPALVHGTQLVLHGILAAMTFVAGRRLGLGSAGAGVAALFVAVAQANVAAVLGGDTLSQVAGTVFGYAGLWGTHEALGAATTERRRMGGLGLAALALLAALLFKETGAAFLLLAGARLAGPELAGLRSRTGWARPAGRLARRLAPFVVVGLVYAALRAQAVGLFGGVGGGRYGLRLGANLARNAALLAGALGTVAPTSALFGWLQAGAWGAVAAAGAAAAAAWAPVAVGIVRSRQRRWAAAVGAVAAGSLIPTYALGHVSELYVYAAVPALALLVGHGAASAWAAAGAAASGRRLLRAGVALATAGLLLGNAAAAGYKASEMEQTGRRAQALLATAVERAREAPPDATLHLVAPGAEGPAYSLFRMPGWRPLAFAGPVVRHRAGRPDVELAIDALTGPPDAPAGPVVTVRLPGAGGAPGASE